MVSTISKVVGSLLFAAIIATHNPVTVDDVDGAIRWLVRGVPSNPMYESGDRHEMAGAVLDAANETGIDPYLLTVMAFRESSFRVGAIGEARGEVGVVQIHGQPLRDCEADGLDMTRPSGQLMCGARYLRQLSDHCGDLTRGLTAYACGSCVAPTDRVANKVASRLRLARRLASKPWETTDANIHR